MRAQRGTLLSLSSLGIQAVVMTLHCTLTQMWAMLAHRGSG